MRFDANSQGRKPVIHWGLSPVTSPARSAMAIIALTVTLFSWGSAHAQFGNDDCASAFPILDVAPIETIGATTDGSDLAGFCDPGPLPDDQIYDDVWFCYTATFTGPARASALLFGPGRLAVYEGCSCPADPALVIGCAENDLMGIEVGVDFAAVAGESYLIRAGAQSPGAPVDGLLQVGVFVPTISGLVCDDTVPGEITATWTLPTSPPPFDSLEISVNGIPTASLAGTETSYTYFLPPAGPTFNEICVTGIIASLGLTTTACCSVGVPVPFNDECAQAEPVLGGFAFFTGVGTTDGSSLAGFCDPGPLPDDQIYNDVWFCWTADVGGPVNARISQFLPFDLRAAVYNTCACPADPADALACVELVAPGFDADLFFDAVVGDTYLFRVGNSDPSLPGVEGFIEIISGIPGVSNLVCDDSTPGTIEMTWDLPTIVTYDSILISEGGSLVATLPGTDTSYGFTYPIPFVGFLSLEVQGVVGPNPPSLSTICTSAIGAPDNDICADARLLFEEETLFDTTVAGDEADPFVMCISPIGIGIITQDIWFRFEAIESEDVTFSLCSGTFFDTVMVLYQDDGTCPPDPLLELACNDDSCGMQSELTYSVLEGQAYLLRVGGSPVMGPLTGGMGVLTVDGTFGTVVGDVFRRGDVNADGGFDVSDAVFTLAALFTPGSPSPTCADAGDANDDGGFDVSDAVFSLAALFTPGSPSPPAPGPSDCDEDPTADSLECDTYDVCP